MQVRAQAAAQPPEVVRPHLQGALLTADKYDAVTQRRRVLVVAELLL